MKRYVKSNKQDDFVKKSLKQRKVKKFIHDSVKDDPNIKRAKKADEELIKELKAQGKSYHPETGEWY